MNPDRVMRGALWTTAVFNVVVGAISAFPASSLGQGAGLPADVPTVYRLLLAWTIALFGLGYGWLATVSEISRPLVVGAALGKAGVPVIVGGLWLVGDAPGRLAFLASGDLVFAASFVWWLRASAR